ncbi:MAG: hypothetical protein KME43_23420 [Myxacorys chilensis ATA2-1-KO14]|jgi:hypothetical protein|nr:hypothetical protein [Myxacorys chilensis ATA2-1-KO14]
MSQKIHLIQKNFGLLGTICGSLIVGLPTISLASPATPSSLNPCPGIYYEEPYNSTKLVPRGCPSNAATRLLSEQTQLPRQQVIVPVVVPSGIPTRPAQPPLPENRAEPIATVTPVAGEVGVRLKNNTNALVSYEAIGYTQRRFLPAGAEATLKLPTPATITMVRQDKGLLKVMSMPSSRSGMLAVSLDETTTLTDNQGVLRIQKDGQVFLN